MFKNQPTVCSICCKIPLGIYVNNDTVIILNNVPKYTVPSIGITKHINMRTSTRVKLLNGPAN